MLVAITAISLEKPEEEQKKPCLHLSSAWGLVVEENVTFAPLLSVHKTVHHIIIVHSRQQKISQCSGERWGKRVFGCWWWESDWVCFCWQTDYTQGSEQGAVMHQYTTETERERERQTILHPPPPLALPHKGGGLSQLPILPALWSRLCSTSSSCQVLKVWPTTYSTTTKKAHSCACKSS